LFPAFFSIFSQLDALSDFVLNFQTIAVSLFIGSRHNVLERFSVYFAGFDIGGLQNKLGHLKFVATIQGVEDSDCVLQFLCDGFAFNKLFVQQLPEKSRSQNPSFSITGRLAALSPNNVLSFCLIRACSVKALSEKEKTSKKDLVIFSAFFRSRNLPTEPLLQSHGISVRRLFRTTATPSGHH